ncbi:hypothetical protein CAPTEDRAFT_219289 [Capitella teleta]|uniref:Abasic site processing protein HMCES n=1 Tax=Capitella teleta TaxID=283909 RepID=R7TQJ0_CAPTE|nr:hypothetical protein CAPTEDRAFT_219289 [Capitella teleta]|eukprot:ELT95929.1 hypothetical protein CAPTEDRAFT_219289 [Capitella teleta]
MCGRTACTLSPDDICKACGHSAAVDGGKGKRTSYPKWQNPPGGQKYYTSYNVAPGSHTPVLVSKKHFELDSPEEDVKKHEGEEVEEDDWVIQPMSWGLVPHWSSEPKTSGYSMINARHDGVLSKTTFKRPLEKGRRCVVLADGYYEWHTDSSKNKQAYFIYFPRSATSDVETVNVEQETPEWTGKRLMTFAGLFDIWRPKKGEEGAPLYSYSIITVDAHKELSWLHERMPAILDGESEIREWLDYGTVPLKKAMDLIRPTNSVTFHPVSSLVNDVKNKSEDCFKPVDLEKKKQSTKASANLMMSWLSKGQKRAPLDDPSVKEEDPSASKHAKKI